MSTFKPKPPFDKFHTSFEEVRDKLNGIKKVKSGKSVKCAYCKEILTEGTRHKIVKEKNKNKHICMDCLYPKLPIPTFNQPE